VDGFRVVAVIASAGLLCAFGGADRSVREWHSQRSHWFQLEAGTASRVFTVRQPSGVVLVNRLTVTHGIRASVTATIPGVAGVRVSAGGESNDPSRPCRRRGSFDVCTQWVEWCPMPRTSWHVRLVKHGGPRGSVRFDFVVGEPKRT
jgi:hypothetical protein